MAILSSGEVVPCCFDYEAIINLGNVQRKSLQNILSNDRGKAIVDGFTNGVINEEPCKHCAYRSKFDDLFTVNTNKRASIGKFIKKKHLCNHLPEPKHL